MSNTEKRESFTLPNGERVEYIDSVHKYYIDGKELPSITQLLELKFGNHYANVDPEILARAAAYGTAVHNELSKFIDARMVDENAEFDTSYPEVYSYFTHIEPFYNVEPVMTERVVVLHDADGKAVACGRFDLLCKVNGELTLADFKTTSSLIKQSVTSQLNLYLVAAYQTGYISTKDIKLAAIHLSGEKAKLVPIPVLAPDFYINIINQTIGKKEEVKG